MSAQGFREGVVVQFVKIVGGVIIQYASRNYLIAPTTVYRTYTAGLFGGGSSGDLYVTWVDKNGNSQTHSERGGTWMSFSTCAEEGTFNTSGSIIEGESKITKAGQEIDYIESSVWSNKGGNN